MNRDPFSSLRKEYRALVPATRRRKSLVLIGRHDTMPHLKEPTIQAIVREDDREALAPLIERLRGNKVHLRLAVAEDGYLDTDLLWRAGERVDDQPAKAV